MKKMKIKKEKKKTLVLSDNVLAQIQKEKQLKNKLKYGEKIRNLNLFYIGI